MAADIPDDNYLFNRMVEFARLQLISAGGAAVVSGAGSDQANGTFVQAGEYNGKPYYGANPAATTGISLNWSGTQWVIRDTFTGDSLYSSDDDVAYPWQATFTADEGDGPAPTVSQSGSGSGGAASAVTQTILVVGADENGSIPAGAKEWTYAVLAGTAGINGSDPLPVGFSDSSDKPTTTAITYETSAASSLYVRYAL